MPSLRYGPSASPISPKSLLGWRRGLAHACGTLHGQNLLGIVDQGIVSGTSFMMTLLIGRLCGARELGTFALAISIVMLVTALHDALISIPFTIFRPQIGHAERSIHAGNSVVQVLLLAAVSVVAFLLTALVARTIFPQQQLSGLCWLIAVAIPGALLRQFMRRYLFANSAISSALLVDGGIAVVQVGAVAIVIVANRLSAPVSMLIVAGATSLVSFTWLAVHRRMFHPRRASLLIDMRRHWQRGRWLVGSEMLSVTCGYATIWILALTMDRSTVGVFSACCVIIQLANPFLLGVGNVLEGRAARALASGGPTALRVVIGSAFRLFIVVIGILSIVAALVGEHVVELIYGAQYANQGQIVTLMAMALLATASGVAASCGLRVIGRADLTFAASAIDLAVLISVAFALSPSLGSVAVAAAVLSGSTAGTIFRLVAFARVSRARERIRVSDVTLTWENQ